MLSPTGAARLRQPPQLPSAWVPLLGRTLRSRREAVSHPRRPSQRKRDSSDTGHFTPRVYLGGVFFRPEDKNRFLFCLQKSQLCFRSQESPCRYHHRWSPLAGRVPCPQLAPRRKLKIVWRVLIKQTAHPSSLASFQNSYCDTRNTQITSHNCRPPHTLWTYCATQAG